MGVNKKLFSSKRKRKKKVKHRFTYKNIQLYYRSILKYRSKVIWFKKFSLVKLPPFFLWRSLVQFPLTYRFYFFNYSERTLYLRKTWIVVCLCFFSFGCSRLHNKGKWIRCFNLGIAMTLTHFRSFISGRSLGTKRTVFWKPNRFQFTIGRHNLRVGRFGWL